MTLPARSSESSSLSDTSRDPREGIPDDDAPHGNHLFGQDEAGSPSVPSVDDVPHSPMGQSPDGTPPQHQYLQPLEEVKTCKVCGDTATGMYFGALVCVPCKTFFLRYAGEGFAYECKNSKSCEVTTATRTQCKFCRYQKCLQVGMCRRVRPAQVEAQDGQQLCVVCRDVANGVHFGVLTCEGCKKFFRRGLQEQKSYRCRGNQNCSINPSNRNACRFCRFQKCLKAGMSREAIQMGRPSKMSGVDNHSHQRSQTKDQDPFRAVHHHLRIPPETLHKPVPIFDPDPDYPGIRTLSGSSLVQLESRKNPPPPPSNGAFPTWMENPMMMMMAPPSDSKRDPWPIRFDPVGPIGSNKPGSWSMDVLPTVGKLSPPKTGSDGERSDGSACPDSTLIRDDSDPFLPVDYTMMQRALTSGDWNADDEYLTSGSRLKQEPLSSDDEGGTTSLTKRSRYDDRFLPQGHLDFPGEGQLKYSSSSAAGKPDATPVQSPLRPPPPPGLGHSGLLIGDISSPGSLLGVGGLGAVRQRTHPDPYSPSALEDYIPNPRPLDPSAVLSQSVATAPTDPCIGSPSVSSSSSNHPFDGQVGSTKGRTLVGQEFHGQGQMMDIEFPCNRNTSRDLPGGGQYPHPVGDDLEGQMEEVGNQCWRTIKQVIPSYHRFVSAGTTINHQLKEAHEAWKRDNPRSGSADELSFWIQSTVVPAYTTVSVAYCKSLPDFTDLCAVDQRILIAGGQSQSRILAAALHWYDAGEKRFRNFLSWRADTPYRADSFKGKLRQFAERVSGLHLDPIEAALLNALGMFNPEHPNLQDRGAIEASRTKILTTVKSYIEANNGSPVDRLDSLWQVLREAQVLGAEHVALTNTRTLGLPPDGKDRASTTERENDADKTPGQLPPLVPEKSQVFGQTTNGRRPTGQQLDNEGGLVVRAPNSRPDADCPAGQAVVAMGTEQWPRDGQRSGQSSFIGQSLGGVVQATSRSELR